MGSSFNIKRLILSPHAFSSSVTVCVEKRRQRLVSSKKPFFHLRTSVECETTKIVRKTRGNVLSGQHLSWELGETKKNSGKQASNLASVFSKGKKDILLSSSTHTTTFALSPHVSLSSYPGNERTDRAGDSNESDAKEGGSRLQQQKCAQLCAASRDKDVKGASSSSSWQMPQAKR